MCFHVFLASNPTWSLSSLNVFPLIYPPLPTSFYHCLHHPYPFLFPYLVHNACFFSVYTWHITAVCDSYNISLFLCHTSSPSRPLSTHISYFSSNSSLFLFYRTRLWKEAEVGRDPSGFDQVKIIIRYSLPFMDAYCFSRGNPGGHIDLSCFVLKLILLSLLGVCHIQSKHLLETASNSLLIMVPSDFWWEWLRNTALI